MGTTVASAPRSPTSPSRNAARVQPRCRATAIKTPGATKITNALASTCALRSLHRSHKTHRRFAMEAWWGEVSHLEIELTPDPGRLQAVVSNKSCFHADYSKSPTLGQLSSEPSGSLYSASHWYRQAQCHEASLSTFRSDGSSYPAARVTRLSEAMLLTAFREFSCICP